MVVWRRRDDGDQRWQIWRAYRDRQPLMRGECYRVVYPELGYRLTYHHRNKAADSEKHFICESLLTIVRTPDFDPSLSPSSFPSVEDISAIAKGYYWNMSWVRDQPLPWLLEHAAQGRRVIGQRLLVISRLWVLRQQILASPAYTENLLGLLLSERNDLARQALERILPDDDPHRQLASLLQREANDR